MPEKFKAIKIYHKLEKKRTYGNCDGNRNADMCLYSEETYTWLKAWPTFRNF